MQAVSTNSPLIKRSRQEAVFLASSMIDRSVATALATLDAAERQSSSVALRLQLSDARAGMIKHRASMRIGYAAGVDEAAKDALQVIRVQVAQPARGAASQDGLGLLEDEKVARFVEASRLQQTTMPVVEHALNRLNSLMSSALGLPVVRAEMNPLRPEVLCMALLKMLDALPEPAEMRAHWVRHLAPPFAHELRRLYESVAKLLQDQGVQEARYRLRLSESSAPARSSPHAGGGSGAGGRTAGGAMGRAARGQGDSSVGATMPSDAEQARRRRTIVPRMGDLARAQPAVPQQLIREFLYRPQWIAEHDEPLPPVYYEAVQQQMASVARAEVPSYDEAHHARERLRQRALSVVDRSVREVGVGMALSPAQWGEQASPTARMQTLMSLKSRATKISQALGLDAVRTLISQVAGDQRVLAPVREAFVALEPALMRMAMSDPRFLGDDYHPARRLIEGVAQRSFNYNDEYAEDFEQFMEPVRAAVRELNGLEQVTEAAFDNHLGALESLWQAEDAGAQAMHTDGLRSMNFAQERQALADKVAREFSLRSDLDRVPAVMADFLFKDWSLVIAHAQLTDTLGQLDPGGYLAVVTDLIWSVKHEVALREPARLFEVLPGLMQTLRRGLRMLGKDPAESAPFFAELMRYHDPVLRLRRLRSARDAEASGYSPLEGEWATTKYDKKSYAVPLERPQPKAAERPWLNRHELVDTGFEDLGDLDETSASDVLLPMPDGDAFTSGPDAAASRPDPLHATPGSGVVSSAIDSAAAAGSDAAPEAAFESSLVPTPTRKPRRGRDEASATLDDEANPGTRALLERLRKGDWVDLCVRDQWHRAQLSWTSDNGSLFMFVSRGGRPHSMTRRTCEKLIRKGNLRPVDAGAVVGNALRSLTDAPPAKS